MDIGHLLGYLWWIVPVVLVLAGYKLVLRMLGAVIVPRDKLAIVTKKFVLFGKNKSLPDGKIIALNGEAGLQADTLAPGLHWGYFPWQYGIDFVEFVTIHNGKVGVVEAIDGVPLSEGRVLAKKVDSDSFQSGRAFLTNGGERGPQLALIPPGTFRINTALFRIAEVDVVEIKDTEVGIVTTKEGQPLRTGDIAGKEIPGHNMFQDPQKFVDGGGFKGLQEQVVLAGRYYINPRFATVERVPLTEVPIAHVGVVISYVGADGVDVTGDAFKHGNLVSKGQKGVWVEPLDPGKYPINPYTHKVELVPTANVVLNWATGKTESHKLDERLSTITVRSSDGFTYNLDVSQIIHIPRSDAPKVIARFGTVENMVTQVLEPIIGNYFRNAAQSSDVIEFLSSRSKRQNEAKQAISDALHDYNVGAVDTLIGDITPPDALMKTLTDRKIAEQERVTYATQEEAQTARQKLEQARALSDTQATVVSSERKVAIAEFEANAAVKTAEGQAKSKTINAEADAQVTKVTGEADAAKITAVGSAEADVIKLKIASMEAGNYATIEVARALSTSGFKLVPDIVAGGDGEGTSTMMNVLLAGLVKDSLAGKNGHDKEKSSLIAPPVSTTPSAPSAPAGE